MCKKEPNEQQQQRKKKENILQNKKSKMECLDNSHLLAVFTQTRFNSTVVLVQILVCTHIKGPKEQISTTTHSLAVILLK